MLGPLANPKWERFCQEYLVDLVPGRAYERAGYKPRGNAADTAGHRLLRNVHIQARIAELKQARSERTQIQADEILRELHTLATSNVDHYSVDGDTGDVSLAHDAPRRAMRAVASIKRKIRTYKRGDDDVREVDVEIRLWDKNSAIDKAMKHLGQYESDNKQKTPDTVRWEVHQAARPTDEVPHD